MELHVSKPEHKNQRLKVLHIHAKASIKHLKQHHETIQMSRVRIELQDEISSLSVAERTLYAATLTADITFGCSIFCTFILTKSNTKQLKQQLDSPQ